MTNKEALDNLERITERGMHWVQLHAVRDIFEKELDLARKEEREKIAKKFEGMFLYSLPPLMKRVEGVGKDGQRWVGEEIDIINLINKQDEDN